MVYDVRETTELTDEVRLELEVFDDTFERFSAFLAASVGELPGHQSRIAYVAALAACTLAELERLDPGASRELLVDLMAGRAPDRAAGRDGSA